MSSLQSSSSPTGASSSPTASARAMGREKPGVDIRDGARPNLTVDEMLSEDEARRRREQLNRRPSYRMILKDLETVGSHDKMPMKRELDDGSNDGHRQQRLGEQQHQQHQLLQPTAGGGDTGNDGGRVSIGRSSPYGASPLSNEGSIGGRNGDGNGPSPLMLRNLATPTGGVDVSMMRSPTHQQQMRNAAEMLAASSAAAVAQRMNLIPSLPRSLLNSNTLNNLNEMPSQPQPHMLTSNVNTSPMLSAVAAAAVANNLLIQPSGELINLGAKPSDSLHHHFSQHGAVDWGSLAAYQQQQQHNHNNAFGGSNIVGPSMGLGNRQGSASLTSLSDNDNNDSTRKRQVRLLKNREAAKECRRKKKEYVKCLENRVAVLENQNKALIEELKTLKELYCRKEKTELT